MRILLAALQVGLLSTEQDLVTAPEPWIKTLPAVEVDRSISQSQLEADVAVKVTIAPNGTPQFCTSHLYSRPKAVVKLACDRMMNATFVSARDANSQPISSVWTGWISISQSNGENPIYPPSGQIIKSGNSWSTSDSYPASARRYEREGTSRFRVLVGKTGRVITCQIAISSGHQDLDEATCANISKRARFRPAMDKQGNAVANYFEGRMKWSLRLKSPPSSSQAPNSPTPIP
jgi:TonB family protein